MDNKTILKISVWILISASCTDSRSDRKDEGARLKVLKSESLPNNWGDMVSDDGAISVSLRKEGRQLNYKIKIRGQEDISVKSGHGIEEQRPRFGENIIVNVRGDKKAMVISEWENSAVAETDPIYINWLHGKPQVMSYTPKKLEKLPEGAGAKVAFFGWLPDGTPEMRIQPE